MEEAIGKPKRLKLRERTLENDIKYRGPLSYRHLRIIAWVCMIFAQIGMVVNFNIKLFPSTVDQLGWLKDLCSFFSSFPLPLFLLANFTMIFTQKGGKGWRSLLIFYGGMAALLYVLGNFVVMHYGFGLVNAVVEMSFIDKAKLFGFIMINSGNLGLVFNIFIDLFLCTLLFFFMNYSPKRIKKEHIIYFRLLTILPIAYEITSIILKYFAVSGAINIPSFVFFLLTSKPPFMFVAFVALVFALKIEERRNLKRHENLEFTKEHRKTNAHSFRFSIIIAIVFTIVGFLDLFTYLFAIVAITASNASDPSQVEGLLEISQYITSRMGFGQSTTLLIVAPLVLLFSYTRTHKNPKIDTFIPVVAVGLIIFLYIEGIYQIIVMNVSALVQKIKDFLQEMFPTTPE